MNIYMRDKSDDLVVKDILSINFDMRVIHDKVSGKYKVRVNNLYLLDGEFETKKDAEEALIHEAQRRDMLECELRNEC